MYLVLRNTPDGFWNVDFRYWDGDSLRQRGKILGGTEYVYIETHTLFFGVVFGQLGSGAERACGWSGPGRGSGSGGTDCDSRSGNSSGRITWSSWRQSNAARRPHGSIDGNNDLASVHTAWKHHAALNDDSDSSLDDGNNGAGNYPDKSSNSGNNTDKFVYHSAGGK